MRNLLKFKVLVDLNAKKAVLQQMAPEVKQQNELPECFLVHILIEDIV